MSKRYYIAYGSNLNIPQMRMRCPGARIIGTSVIEDYQLLFKGSKTGSYLTIEPMEGAEVPVVIWEVTETDDPVEKFYEELRGKKADEVKELAEKYGAEFIDGDKLSVNKKRVLEAYKLSLEDEEETEE